MYLPFHYLGAPRSAKGRTNHGTGMTRTAEYLCKMEPQQATIVQESYQNMSVSVDLVGCCGDATGAPVARSQRRLLLPRGRLTVRQLSHGPHRQVGDRRHVLAIRQLGFVVGGVVLGVLAER